MHKVKRKVIPATIVPNNYFPLVYNNFNGMYIYTYNNPEDIIIHPRYGNNYNTDICITPSIYSGNIQLFNNGKKVWVTPYELIEQNENYLHQIQCNIDKECRNLRRKRLGIG